MHTVQCVSHAFQCAFICSHIFGPTNFPVLFFAFPVVLSVSVNKFTKYKNPFNKYTSIKWKSHRKIKSGLKSPYFSSILGEIPSLFQSVQNCLTFSCLEKVFPLPGFPDHMGTIITLQDSHIIWLTNFPDLSSILCKLFFNMFKISWLFPDCKMFSHFPEFPIGIPMYHVPIQWRIQDFP